MNTFWTEAFKFSRSKEVAGQEGEYSVIAAKETELKIGVEKQPTSSIPDLEFAYLTFPRNAEYAQIDDLPSIVPRVADYALINGRPNFLFCFSNVSDYA